jgi:hypothetical protein
MHLNATLLYVMNCVVKFNIANGCTLSLTVSEIVTYNEDGDPFVRKHTGDFSYYNAAHYLERVEAAPAVDPATVTPDHNLIRLMDIIIAIATDQRKDESQKCVEIATLTERGINVACITKLQKEIGELTLLEMLFTLIS